MSRVTLVMLSSTINKVLGNDKINAKKELESIDYRCKDVTTKFFLQYYERLEYYNLMLGKNLA